MITNNNWQKNMHSLLPVIFWLLGNQELIIIAICCQKNFIRKHKIGFAFKRDAPGQNFLLGISVNKFSPQTTRAVCTCDTSPQIKIPSSYPVSANNHTRTHSTVICSRFPYNGGHGELICGMPYT